MKVLYVIDSLGTGGAERSLAELIGPLRERGVAVEVATLHRREEGVRHQLLRQGVVIHELSATSFLGRIVELRRLLRRLCPDLVHTTLYMSDLLGRLAAVGVGVPVVSSVVSTTYDPVRWSDPQVNVRRLRVLQLIDGLTMRACTAYVHAVSEAVAAATVRDLRMPASRVKVIARGRDPRRLGEPTDKRRALARTALGIREETVVLVHVGRQEWAKNLPAVAGAVARLRAADHDVVLLQAGRSGGASSSFQEELDRRGAGDVVRQLGHRSDVPDVLAAGDLFVFPSHYEGMPGAVLEAMAMGLPIIGSDIPPVREVTDDSCAILVPAASPDALASALEQLVLDRELRLSLGRAARQRFMSHYTLAAIADRTTEFYALSVRRSTSSGQLRLSERGGKGP